jgi:hypothetical protein
MSSFSIISHKIDPTRSQIALRPDGSIDDNDRVEIGPTGIAFAEWAALSLSPPTWSGMRNTRLQRIVGQLRKRDYDGVLCFGHCIENSFKQRSHNCRTPQGWLS